MEYYSILLDSKQDTSKVSSRRLWGRSYLHQQGCFSLISFN